MKLNKVEIIWFIFALILVIGIAIITLNNVSIELAECARQNISCSSAIAYYSW